MPGLTCRNVALKHGPEGKKNQSRITPNFWRISPRRATFRLQEQVVFCKQLLSSTLSRIAPTPAGKCLSPLRTEGPPIAAPATAAPAATGPPVKDYAEGDGPQRSEERGRSTTMASDFAQLPKGSLAPRIPGHRAHGDHELGEELVLLGSDLQCSHVLRSAHQLL